MRIPVPSPLSADGGHVLGTTQASATEGRPRLPAHGLAKATDDGLRLGVRRKKPAHARLKPRRTVRRPPPRHGQRRPCGQEPSPSRPRLAAPSVIRASPSTYHRLDAMPD